MENLPMVRIVYGPTGGRFPLMFGVAKALEEALDRLGVGIIDRVGISGGSIVAAVRSAGRDFPDWMRENEGLGKFCTIGGWKLPVQLWSLLRHGGLLNSKTVLQKTFQSLISTIPTEPCYAVSWCSSAKKPVAFSLMSNPLAATCVLASAAIPIAFSPVVIPNSDLSPEIRQRIGVTEEGVSRFQDGGLSDAFPAMLIDQKIVPTIMVFIDPVPMGGEERKSKDVWDRVFGIQNKALLLAASARKKQNTQLFVVPTVPEMLEHSMKFDLQIEDAMAMYRHGFVMAHYTFRLQLDLPTKEVEQRGADSLEQR